MRTLEFANICEIKMPYFGVEKKLLDAIKYYGASNKF